MLAPSIRRSLLSLSLAALAAGSVLAQNGAELQVGSKLIFAAYGDTRPNLWPFGDQAKHKAIARAIQQVDRATNYELDLVLMSGDLIFADVPFTNRDWKPAWEALGILRNGAHSLYIYPSLGNHELVTPHDHESASAEDRMIRSLWAWGGSPVAVRSQGPAEPVILAQMTHVAELQPLLSKHLPAGTRENDLRELWIQISSDAAGRMTEADRQALEQARVEARRMLRVAAAQGESAEQVASKFASLSSDTILESLHEVAHAAAEGEGNVARLASGVLARLGDPASPQFAGLKRHLAPAVAHLDAIVKVANEARGEQLETRWMRILDDDARGALAKSWGVLREHLIEKLGRYVVDTTSLKAHGVKGTVAPSWYYTDRRIPGSPKSIRFIACNSNLASLDYGPGTPEALNQEAFLVQAIRSHDGPIVLTQHHSPVSIGGHGGEFDVRKDLISAFRDLVYRRVFSKLTPDEQKRIWAFISGHDHDYQKMIDKDRGTAILVSGGGGVPLRGKGMEPSEIPGYLEKCGKLMGTTIDSTPIWRRAYNFVICEVNAGKMDFKVYGLCEKDKTMDDPEFEKRLPGAIDQQLANPVHLIDRFTISETASGRVVESQPVEGCR